MSRQESYLDSGGNKQGLERFAGVTLTNPGCRHTVQRPLGEKGITKFRIYPYFDNGVEKPLRLEPAVFRERMGQNAGPTCEHAYYPWLAMEEMISMAGVSGKFTAFARVRDKDNRYQGPFHRFFRGMYSALKNSPTAYPRDWAQWIGKQGALPGISAAGLLQGILYINGGKPVQDQYGQANPMHPVILVLPKTARESLEQLVDMRFQGAQAMEEDFDKAFPYNQLVSCANGKILTINYHPASQRNTTYYDCAVDPDPFPINPDLARSEFVSWNQLLYRMDEKEQMATLAAHFPPEALSFIFDSSDFRDYLPSGVAGRWDAYVRGGGSYAVPATPAPQPQYSAPPASTPQALRNDQMQYARQQLAQETGPVAPMPPAAPPAFQPDLTAPPAPQMSIPSLPAAPVAPSAPAAPPVRFNAPTSLQSAPPSLPPHISGVPAAPSAPTAGLTPGVPPIFNAPTIQKAFSGPPPSATPGPLPAPIGDPAVDRTQNLADARARLAEASKNLPPSGSPQR